MKSLKSFFVRFTAFLVMASMFLASMPLNILQVYANYQSNLRNVTIENVPSSGDIYKFNIAWTKPSSWSTTSDNTAVNGSEPHTPDGYKLLRANATARETSYEEIDEITDTAAVSASLSETLNSGSIYSYKVRPYHNHIYEEADGTRYTGLAPYESSPAEETVLYMTDILVEATGSGNSLTITWDNPTYQGQNVFSGYNIYYQAGGESVSRFENQPIAVGVDDENITTTNDSTRKGVTRFTYTIQDSSIVPGEFYAVKVEPLFKGGQEIRRLPSGYSYETVSISGQQYKIAFRDIDTEFRNNDAYVKIPLTVQENGSDYLKLHWWGLSNTIGEIEYIKVYSGNSESSISNNIGTIYSPNAIVDAMNVEYWKVEKPNEKTYYQIQIKIKNKDTLILSEIAAYDPSKVNITPNKPDLYLKLNPGDTVPAIDAYWDVFIRYPYNSSEESGVESDGTYIDRDVNYSIWLTDTIDRIDDVNMPVIVDDVNANAFTETTIDGVSTPVYTTTLSEYYAYENGAYVKKNIEKNKTYYVKLVAVKHVDGERDLYSEYVYSSLYVPIDSDISKPQMLSKPPLRIKKDADGNELITRDTITVEWNTKWFEVYDEATDSWYSKVAINPSGELVYDKNIDEENDKIVDFHSAETEQKVKDIFEAAGYSGFDNLVIRNIDLKSESIGYDMVVTPYDTVNQAGSYHDYVQGLINNTDTEWTAITPSEGDNGYLEYMVTGLNKNTTYIILLKPYRILEDGTIDSYPTYIMGTTLPDDTPVNITPTVPALGEKDHTDVSVTVEWKYAPNLDYELSYSEVLLTDPGTGKIIASDEISKNGSTETKEEDSEQYMNYQINNLFPETGYYIWIRSIARNEDGDAYSVWSNPIFVTTDEVKPPSPPDGLGLVSKENIKIYNKTNETDFLQSDYNYLIIEWLKNYYDTNDTSEASGTGTGFEVLTDANINETFIVKFNDLEANTRYYVRAKTVLTITKNADGGSEKSYNYVVQFSINEDFKDAIEVTLPDSLPAVSNGTLQKESDWTDVISFVTEPSDGEYDAHERPEFYPLPDEDFELVYDYPTRTLTYRFRSDKEDEDRKDDNSVDQRFISRLLQKKVYVYGVDLTSFKNSEIKARTVRIPYSIIQAFNERDITFELKADNATFSFKSDFVMTDEVKSIGTFGKKAEVVITVDEMPLDVPVLTTGQTFSSKPQKVSVKVVTPDRTVDLTNTYSNFDVKIKLASKADTVDKNLDAYFDSATTDIWNRIDSRYNAETGSFEFSTNMLVSYSVIGLAAPSATRNDPQTISAVAGINTRMYIKDIQSYNPTSAVSSLQFNNVVAAVANGSKEADLNSALSTEDTNALSKKGILLGGSILTRAQAIDALVKLYEAKTKSPVLYYSSLSQTQYSDIASAPAQYQQSLLKAGDLGFFGNTIGARPNDTMSLGDLFYIVDIIVQDSGM